MTRNTDIPAGYKPSPLGPIPEDWEVKRLGELGVIVTGLTYSPDDINESGVLVLRSSNIRDGRISLEDNVYVKVERYNAVRTGDILICVRNGSCPLIGKNALITKDVEGVAFGAFMAVFRSEHNKYLFQLFATDYYYKNVYRNLGATINSINGTDLLRFMFPMPPTKEQQQIAEILSTWDKAIELQSVLIEKLTLRKKGLMQQILTGKKRLKGFSESWRKIKLGTIGITYSGLSGMHKEDFESGNMMYIPYINIFQNSIVDILALGKVNICNNQNRVLKGDVLFTTSSETPEEVGVSSVLLESVDKLYLNSFCFGYRLNNTNTLLPEFAAYIFRQSMFRREIFKLAQGSTRFNISPKEVMKISISLPQITEQLTIVQILMSTDLQIEKEQHKLMALKQQKKGLMQQLLTGKKRVAL